MVEYTGVHGIVEIDGIAVAVGEFTVKFPRGIAEFARSGKYSKLKLPGIVDCTGSLRRIMTDGSSLTKVLGAESAGTAVELHAGLTLPASDTSENIADMTQTDSQSSLIKITESGSGLDSSGNAILIGTDINDADLIENVAMDDLDASANWTSVNIFKTLTHVALIDASGNGTLKVEAITGAATITTLGEADYFDLKGKAVNGNSYIEVSLTNCFFTEAGLAFTDADTIIEETLPFVVKDLDVGTSIKHLTSG